MNTILGPTHKEYSSLALKIAQGGDWENRSRLMSYKICTFQEDARHGSTETLVLRKGADAPF